MKDLILTVLLFFVLYEMSHADPRCLDEDIARIEYCYHKAYGNESNWGDNIVNPLLMTNVSKAFWQPLCEIKSYLNNCIGSIVVESCFNEEDIKRLSFIQYDGMAKMIIAAFIETDHICDKLFKFSDDDYNCFNKVFPKMDKFCPDKISSCESLNKTLDCVIRTTYKKCGNNVGCFEQKNAFLMMCWFESSSYGCNVCDGISVTNNLIDDICKEENDDEHVGEKDVEKNSFFLSFN